MGKISEHANPNCAQIQKKNKIGQRSIYIDTESLESELNKLRQGDLKFASFAGLNDVWVQINLGDAASEESLVRTIREIFGRTYKRLARAEIKIHCPRPADSAVHLQKRQDLLLKPSLHSVLKSKDTIPNRENKIEEIIRTITSRMTEFNTRYRSGPSLYFYKRIIELRREHPQVANFISDNYCLEMLYATLVSWDMNSRGAKLKYFDDFRNAMIFCLPKYEAIEIVMLSFDPAKGRDLLGLLKSAYEGMALMQTSGRLVSNSKCLHFLFPSLCMPMDKTNTLQYLFGNTYESVNRYLDVIEFSFDIMRQPVQFNKYLDDSWNQTVPKIIDNAIILLQGRSIKKQKTKRLI